VTRSSGEFLACSRQPGSKFWPCTGIYRKCDFPGATEIAFGYPVNPVTLRRDNYDKAGVSRRIDSGPDIKICPNIAS
jgi:hypothetical protein